MHRRADDSQRSAARLVRGLAEMTFHEERGAVPNLGQIQQGRDSARSFFLVDVADGEIHEVARVVDLEGRCFRSCGDEPLLVL